MQTLRAQRLQNQQMEYPRFDHVVDVLSHLGAIQGQDFIGAKWSLGLRLPDSTDADVEQAITDKQMVRTWLWRGTLFLTTAADVRWMLELVAPRIIAQSQRRYKELELDAQTLTHCNDILVEALADGQQHSRRQLYAILEEQGISTKGQRGVHIVRHTSLEGLIIQGTVDKNDPVFMSLDDVTPATQTIPKDVALAELARRYFNSRGLATLHDFAWWTGLLMADVRTGVEAIRSELEEVTIDGNSYYRVGDATTQPAPPSPTVYVPPGFDEYLLGYKDRDVILEPDHAMKVCPGKNGMFFPTMVIDGHIRGVWKRTIKKKQMQIQAMPFAKLTHDEEQAFEKAIQKFGAFWGCDTQVNFQNSTK